MLLFILSALFGITPAQDLRAVVPQNDRSRIEQLIGLAKVWGTVKYFHPYLAYREIDWDRALVETLPQVNAAKTPQEYSAAINHLLSFLDDQNSYAEVGAGVKSANKPEPDVKEFLRLENGVLYVEPVAASIARNQDQEKYLKVLQKNLPLIDQAQSIIIDARGAGDEPSELFNFTFYDFLRQIFEHTLDVNITLGSYRSRMHNGYAPQIGTSSGGYYSSTITTAPETLMGKNKNKMLPTVLLVNEQTPLPATIISGLQATKKVIVLRTADSAREPGVKTFKMKLPDGVSVTMRTAELINPDGTVGFQPDILVSEIVGEDSSMKEALRIAGGGKVSATRKALVMANAPQIPPKDNPYAEMAFPNSEYRLLSLFRFWNVINYFFPYKDLIGKQWDEVLASYIPRLEACKDAADYQLTVRSMVSKIHDSHGFVTGTPASAKQWGLFVAPVSITRIQDQAVVNYVFDDVKNVKAGDTVLAVNGEPADSFIAKHAAYFSASTPQALARVLYTNFLRGPENSRFKLKLRASDGSIRETEVAATVTGNDPRWAYVDKKQKELPVFTVLPSGYGYVDLGRLNLGDVNKMFATIKDAPGTIFDMRGYPNGTAWEIAPRLTEKTNVPAALFSNPIWEAMNLGEADYINGTSFGFTQYLPERKGDVYKGKIVMLINEYAQSQSEHTCLFFEAATNVTFVGTPTAGANGDISYMVLPGNISVGFTGHNVRHADGRQLQRMGIQPTIKVEPTIRGLFVEKRDEILDAAIKFLESNKTKPKAKE